MRHRRAAWLAVGALALVAVAERPTARIHIDTHEVADLNPRQMKAFVDVGLVAVDVLVTWSARTLR